MPYAPPPQQREASVSDSGSRHRPNFTGYWRVVKVEGLDAFLKVRRERESILDFDGCFFFFFVALGSTLLASSFDHATTFP